MAGIYCGAIYCGFPERAIFIFALFYITVVDLIIFITIELTITGFTKRPEPSYREEVTELLRWVGLGDRMNAYPEVLSGGEKQRAAIARALIVRPELLLADEPTGNVDPTMARRLIRLFVELQRSGTSVVVATHDLGLMDQFDGARRLVLGGGRLHIYD